MRRVRPGKERKKEKKKGKKRRKKEFRLDSNDFDFICAGVRNVGSYKRKHLT